MHKTCFPHFPKKRAHAQTTTKTEYKVCFWDILVFIALHIVSVASTHTHNKMCIRNSTGNCWKWNWSIPKTRQHTTSKIKAIYYKFCIKYTKYFNANALCVKCLLIICGEELHLNRTFIVLLLFAKNYCRNFCYMHFGK